MPEARAVIQNVKGLHARAAARFVNTASEYTAKIQVSRDAAAADDEHAGPVSAGSILGLMMLGADKGTALLLNAEGEDAEKALEALVSLINQRFDEE